MSGVCTGSGLIRVPWPICSVATLPAGRKDTLYRCHDQFLEHKQALFIHLQRALEGSIQREFEVLLYDLTSTYFESDPPFGEEDKRHFGY